MEVSIRQFIPLGSRNKSQSKLKKSQNKQNSLIQPGFRPLAPIQTNAGSRIAQSNHNNGQQSKQWRSVHASNQPMNYGQTLKQSLWKQRMPDVEIRKDQSRQNMRYLPVNESRKGSPSIYSSSPSRMVISQNSKNHLNLTLTKNQKSQSSKPQNVEQVSHFRILEQALSQKQTQKRHLESIIILERQKCQHQGLKIKKFLRESEESKQRISYLEQMLQRQISKSLQLMDENQTLTKQLEDIKTELLVKDTVLSTLSQQLKISHQEVTSAKMELQMHIETSFKQNQDHKTHINTLLTQIQSIKNQKLSMANQFNQQIQALQLQVSSLKTSLNQKSSQFLDLQNSHALQLKNLEQQGEVQINKLNQTLHHTNIKLELLQNQLKQSGSHAKQRLSSNYCQSQSDKTECKKCKELLQTVFRLNSHLNKK